MTGPKLATTQHQQRAERHRVIGAVLDEAGDEWAAVPYFYSAYHLIKASLLVDPIWGDVSQMHTLHINLVSDDRFTDRHHGRRGSHQAWGVNELVMLLYPVVVKQYERLHQASIGVRYSTGLPEGALSALRPDLDHIWSRFEAGALVAGT